MRARQMVSERMTQAVAMPHVSKPPIMLQPLSATNRVMIIGLSSKTVSHIQYVGAGSLDDSAAADGRARRRQRFDLGSARPAASGAGRSKAPGRKRTSRCCKFWKPPVTRCGFRRCRSSKRRRRAPAASSTRRISDSASGISCRSFRPTSSRKFRSRTQKASASAMWRTSLKIISR